MRKKIFISLSTWTLLMGISLTTLPYELVGDEEAWTEIASEEGKEQQEEQKQGEEGEKEAEDIAKYSDSFKFQRFDANSFVTNVQWGYLNHFNWVNPTFEIIVPPPERLT